MADGDVRYLLTHLCRKKSNFDRETLHHPADITSSIFCFEFSIQSYFNLFGFNIIKLKVTVNSLKLQIENKLKIM